MGLLKHILFWPVTGPLFLAEFSLGKVEGVVREELTDDTRIKAELMELQLKLELGDIDDDEYVRQEAALMQQLREVRQWREQFGMGVSGGPVRVQAQPSAPEPPARAADAVAGAAAGAAPGDNRPGGNAAGADPTDADSTDDQAANRRPRVVDGGAGADIELNLDWD